MTTANTTLSEKAQKAKSEYIKKWKAANKDKVNEYFRKWRAANKDKIKVYNQRFWEKQAEKISQQ